MRTQPKEPKWQSMTKVYFIQQTEAPYSIKIGVAEDPERRLRELQTGNPCPLTLLGFMYGGEQDEARLHEEFDRYRLAGEWFAPAPEILRCVGGLRKDEPKTDDRAASVNGATRGPLDTKHTTVHTMSIDVKVMKVGKKQVTQSVFRQLPERSIFRFDFGTCDTPTVSLQGIPWGVVRYVWNGCPDWSTQHVVWQDRGILCRCPVISNPSTFVREWRLECPSGKYSCSFRKSQRDGWSPYDRYESIEAAAETKLNRALKSIPDFKKNDYKSSFLDPIGDDDYEFSNVIADPPPCPECFSHSISLSQPILSLELRIRYHHSPRFENFLNYHDICVEACSTEEEENSLLSAVNSYVSELARLDQLFIAV